MSRSARLEHSRVIGNLDAKLLVQAVSVGGQDLGRMMS